MITEDVETTATLDRATDADRDDVARLRTQVAADQAQIAHLQEALRSARTIGMALGIIMAREKVQPDDAFARLSDLSQRANTKVRALAETIALTGEY